MSTLKEMEVGQNVEFPAEKLSSVCTSVCNFAFATGRKFKTKRFTKENGKRVVSVTRYS